MAANMASGSSMCAASEQQLLQQQQQQQQQANIGLNYLPPVIQPEYLLNNDRGLFKVYCFIKDFIGASGTSAVAIDNKIEQAMDLVKSHLMIAVREEVEVLKERISELMDKINNLEVENTILKSNMSPETLQQLQMQIAGSQQPAAVAAPPATPAIQAPPAVATAPASNAATSPATATAPLATIMPTSNGSVADSGSNNGEAATVATNGAIAAPQSAVTAATAAAQPAAVSATTASVNTNGPMS